MIFKISTFFSVDFTDNYGIIYVRICHYRLHMQLVMAVSIPEERMKQNGRNGILHRYAE